ncbi:MAG: flagellar motor protein MotB [Planctomycetota bacterium]
MAKKKKAEEPGVPEWVVTYGDMMSLLLCFFILLAAFSELKKERDFQDVLKELRQAFGYQGGVNSSPGDSVPTNSNMNLLDNLQARNGKQDSMAESVDPNVEGREERSQMIREGERWLIGAALPFAPSSAEISPWSRDMLLNEIAPKLRDTRNVVRVVGHAWGVEDRASGGLMELSFRRARAVAELLMNEGGVPAVSLRVVSASDSEPAGLAGSGGGGADAAGNRRVEVILSGTTVDQVHPDPEFTGRASVSPGGFSDGW